MLVFLLVPSNIQKGYPQNHQNTASHRRQAQSDPGPFRAHEMANHPEGIEGIFTFVLLPSATSYDLVGSHRGSRTWFPAIVATGSTGLGK